MTPARPALQHFTADVVSAVRACGAHLGAAASRYGSGDVAEDVDAVRAALGIDQIVYYGGSFGAHNVRAYAYRYPDRLQAAAFDSPWLSADYTFQASNARFLARVQATVCRRSPACVGANPFPEADLVSLALIARVFAGQAEGLTPDDVLDNATLYWLTRTGVSSARLYWESKLAFFAPKGVELPTGVSVFPDEIYAAPRSWAEAAYPNLIHFNRLPKGGHFAAWEQPQLFSAELRATFRALR